MRIWQGQETVPGFLRPENTGDEFSCFVTALMGRNLHMGDFQICDLCQRMIPLHFVLAGDTIRSDPNAPCIERSLFNQIKEFSAFDFREIVTIYFR